MAWQDLKYAVRLLIGQPSFTLVALLTLALGIGANAAMFSMVYGVLLKPLPFREPERLVQLWETNPLRNWTDATASPANLLDWRRRNRAFEEIAFYPGLDDRTPIYADVSLAANDDPQRLRAVQVSANFFRVLGVSPALGRAFTDADEIPGTRVAVLTHAAWSTQFRSDTAIVGRDITLNTRSFRVVGVLPPQFRFPSPDVDLYLPFAMSPDLSAVRRPHYLRPIARLKPGVSVEQARADLRGIAADLEREYPDTNTQMSADLGPLHEWTIGGVRRSLFLFLAAVALVLLIACANLANLLLARGAGRARELAIRSALGSARWKLVRQLLTESLVLACAGGLVGVPFAQWMLAVAIRLSPPGIPRLHDVVLDGPVLVCVALLSIATALVFGTAPAWHGARVNAIVLREGTRTSTSRALTRRVLVIGQVAASVALLVTAGLLLRSFARLQAVPPGFDASNVVTWKVTLPAAKYAEDGRAARFFDELVVRLRSIPGVSAAGGATVLGLEGRGWTGDVFVEGRPDFHGRELGHKDVTDGYFSAVGLPILRGRGFASSDTAAAAPVVVVNEAFVRMYFQNEDPVGRRISFSYDPQRRNWHTIIGIVRDEKQETLAETVKPEVYGNNRQAPRLTIAVRTAVAPQGLIASLRAAVRAQDPGVAMYDVRTLDQVVSRSVARERFTAWVVTVFAALACLIAAIGLFGVVAYSVSQRTREIGIRVALGAARREVVRLVFQETLTVLAAGVAAGVAIAVAAGESLRPLLFDIQPTDAPTYVAVCVCLAVVGLAASYVPVRRALSVDPMSALRAE